MRYSTEPREPRIYVKEYGLFSYAKNIGKNLSNKYSQKLLDSTTKSTANANYFKKSNSKNCRSNWWFNW